MIDGMITATAVVATMPLIHNNAGDFGRAPERFPNGSAGVAPVCIAGMKLATPRTGFSRTTDAVNLQKK
jgi:hypothetical protein